MPFLIKDDITERTGENYNEERRAADTKLTHFAIFDTF